MSDSVDPNGPGPDKEGLVALERVELSDDEDDDFAYDGVSVDGLSDTDGEEEDFATVLRTINAGAKQEASQRMLEQHGAGAAATTSAAVKPSVIDDFIRNFLLKMGMRRTLDEFNAEWYELQLEGKLQDRELGSVPDVYLKNQKLEERVGQLQAELQRMMEIAEKARSTWDKFRKERDFHKMHHQRVVVEKKKLVTDLKRLRKHFDGYEPALQELQRKYEAAMKEKMLVRLERDRLQARVNSLEATLRSFDEEAVGAGGLSPQAAGAAGAGAGAGADKSATHPRAGRAAGAGTERSPGGSPTKRAGQRTGKPRVRAEAQLPEGDFHNPFATLAVDPAPAERFTLSKTFKGHANSVAGIAFHPRKQILATVSDDETWRLWAVPQGDLIMSGEGHRAWVAGVAFHPEGKQLATASGDGQVKLWDFVSAACSATMSDHTQAVWGVAFHHAGDFLVSCSMDHTSKLWDLATARCRQTFRGHVDSVNAVCFQPFTNNICTGSGDKTVSLWDARSGLCIQTLYGHKNACNHVAFNLQVWDVRGLFGALAC